MAAQDGLGTHPGPSWRPRSRPNARASSPTRARSTRKASIEFAAAALTQNYTWRERGNPVPPAQQTEPLREALEALLRMPEERYTDDQWEVLGAILELLPRAAAQLKLVFAERGETDFTEIAQGAVRALGTPDNPTDLLLALDTRIKHILVDEFQDTSYSQYELLEKLTSGWERDDGRTLFVVGDPMQSIYRFREAKVALFLQAWERGLGTRRARAPDADHELQIAGRARRLVQRLLPAHPAARGRHRFRRRPVLARHASSRSAPQLRCGLAPIT